MKSYNKYLIIFWVLLTTLIVCGIYYFSGQHTIDSHYKILAAKAQFVVRSLDQRWINHLLTLGILIIVSYLLYLFVQKNFTNYSLHHAMKQAMKHKQFYPVYQPIYDSVTQAYSGIEVLLRWSDFNDEIIMPDYFIAEAERTGIIIPITLQIIETAFIETKKLLESRPFFYVSFNVSALHFTDKDFFDRFYALVAQYSIPPKQIIIEITERDFIDKNNHIFIIKMQKLIKKGFSLAIDDYGTGHASISYIQNFPFNYLKIDRIFVQAIGTQAINESLIDTIISMAKNLNLKIIAEGVETSEQVNYLIHNKVPYLQGWYFSKALTIEALMDLLEGKNDDDLL